MLESKNIILPISEARLTLKQLPALVLERQARKCFRLLNLEGTFDLSYFLTNHDRDLRRNLKFATVLFPNFHDIDNNSVNNWRDALFLFDALKEFNFSAVLKPLSFDIPVSLTPGNRDFVEVDWCSNFLAIVLQSGKASYVELETCLSMDDAVRLYELHLAECINNSKLRQSR